MIGELPFFMAAGFCFGLWQGRAAAWLYLALRWPGGPRAYAAQALALAFAGIVIVSLLQMLGERPHALGIAFAGLVVGWAGGRWFLFAPWERDKIVFVAAAGAFIAIGAYEYDYRGLRNITKFSAGSVDLEFSGSGRSGGSPTIGLIKSSDDARSLFPGRERLSTALNFLRAIPDNIIRDEQYGEMFSGYSQDYFEIDEEHRLKDTPYPNGEKIAIEPTISEFYAFYDRQIVPFIKVLRVIHEYHKGEISSISLKPDVLFQLRLLFENRINLNSKEIRPDVFVKTICEAMILLQSEIEVIPNKVENSDIFAKARDAICNASTLALPSLRDRRATSEDAFEFTAYFAMLSALAEFAVENRERAIQLLDSVIHDGSPYEKKDPEIYVNDRGNSAAAKACDGAPAEKRAACRLAASRLFDARRLVVMARLENLEDTLIELSDNSGLKAIRISLLRRAIRDADEALNLYSRTVDFDRKALFGAKTGNSGSACRIQIPSDPQAQGLLSRWIASAMGLRANALETAADRPDVVKIKPFLVPVLDGYAVEVASFDAECASKYASYLKDKLAPNLRSFLLTPVASYWEAKGEGFGAVASDEAKLSELNINPRKQIAALCIARNTYQFAKQIYVPTDGINSPDEDTLDMDQRGEAYNRPALEERMAFGYARSKALLENFSAADVEKNCP